MAQSLNDVVKDVLAILTSVVASSKGNVTLGQLEYDFTQLTGYRIPLTKLGHTSLINFLCSFPDTFRITYSYDGKAYVSSLSEGTKHIEKFVQTQKSSLKSRKRPPAKRFHQMRIPRFSYNQQPRSHYSSSGSFGKRLHNPVPTNNRSTSNPPKPLLPLPPLLPSPPVVNHYEQRSLYSQQNGNNYFTSKSTSGNVSPVCSKWTASQTSEPSFNPQLERTDPQNESVLESTREDETLLYNPLIEKTAYQPKSKFPVHNHTLLENSASSFRLSINTQKSKEVKRLSYKEKLNELAIRHGLLVNYSPVPCGKKKSGYICSLKVGDEHFKSYPKSAPSVEEVKEYVAEIAYKKLKETLKDLSPPLLLPETTDIVVVACRLKEMLRDEDEGLWWDSLQTKYQKQYHETLSEDCIPAIKQNFSDEISVLNIELNSNWILSLKKKYVPLNNTASEFDSHDKPCLAESDIICELSSLTLPNDRMLTIFVTYIKNCYEVWFRIIGEEYSDAFENLVTDMELFYMEKSNLHPVITPDIESYYACNYDESWCRVKFLKIEGGDAEILFVDAGDTEVVNLSSLFLLDPQFLNLPCQSVRCVLGGLEGCDSEDHAVLSRLQNYALGKPLVAEVTSKEEYLTVILYDTSTDEDINVNEQLLKLMPENYPEPALPSVGGICEVYISHVSAKGEIFVRLETATYKTLETLLTTARRHTAEMLGDDSIDIDLSKLYLAKFSADGEWHRAAPRTANKNNNGEVILKAIDKGFSERVASHNIIQLKNLSESLCKIPAQVIPCKLHNVPSGLDAKWTRRATERLLSITSDGPLLLKVALETTDTEVAEVQLFIRTPPHNLLVSINDTLDMEHTLFCDEDSNNNCRNDSLPNTNGCKGLETILSSPSYCSGEAFDKQELDNPFIPELNSYHDIYVTYAATPSNFAVQSFKTKSKLEMLMGEMFSYYSLEANQKLVKEIYEGGYYALLHTDESWYRVRVIQICSGQVSGHFVDYGDFFCATPDAFQSLCPNFRILPRQSLKATLGGIVPVGKDWTPIDCIRFGKLVHEKELFSQIIGIEYPELDSHLPNFKMEPPTLVLRLVDTSEDNVDKYIDQILINEKRAIRV